MPNVIDVSTKTNHSIARYSNGDLWVTGDNSRGQLGIIRRWNNPILIPISKFIARIVKIPMLQSVSSCLRTWENSIGGLTDQPEIGKIAVGYMHSLVIMADESLWVTGFNSNGQLGLGDDKDRYEWIQSIAHVRQVAAGSHHSFVLKNDGSLWGTGNNQFGQIGGGSNECKVLNWRQSLTNVIAIACGDNHSLALKNDGSLWATGFNSNGELGLGDTDNRNTWVKAMDSVSTLSNSNLMISGGHRHSLVCKADGSLWGTGANDAGMLGLGDNKNRQKWTCCNLINVCGVSAGYSHSLAVVDGLDDWNKKLFSTGTSDAGALGLGWGVTSLNSWTETSKRVRHAVAGGNTCSFALCQDGLWVCGNNNMGQCGVPDDPNDHFDYEGKVLYGWIKTIDATL